MKSTDVTIIYAFDIESEIPFWKLSLKSLIKTNGKDINLLTLVTNDKLKKEVLKIYDELKLNNNFKVKIINDLVNIKKEGQFLWLRSSFHVNTRYILQLDNDILINCSIIKLIDVTITKDKKIWGVRVRISKNEKMLKTLKDLHKFKLKKSIKRKWINAGVVLMDSEWFRNELISESKLKNMLKEFSEINYDLDFAMIADESFLIYYFHKFMGSMSGKWNLRFQSPKSAKKYINDDEWIFHFNLRRKIENKYIKYDFSEFLFNENVEIDKISKEISEFLITRLESDNKIFIKKFVYPYVDNIITNLLKAL